MDVPDTKTMMVAEVQAILEYVTAMMTCATSLGSVPKIDSFENNPKKLLSKILGTYGFYDLLI